MCFPKAHTVAVFVIFLFFCNASLHSQALLFEKGDSIFTCRFNSEKLELLIENDSLYKATTLLNEAIDFATKYKLKSTEAKTYTALGRVLSRLSNYKNAETYHLKALKIFDSIKSKKLKDRVLSNLANTYLLDKNFTKFDSIYPYAQSLSQELNSELYFINLNNKIKRHYYDFENAKLLKTSERAIEELTTTNFESLVLSEVLERNQLKNKLLQSYKYHNAIAHIKQSEAKDDKFNLLFSLSEGALKSAFDNDPDSSRKLATFNYYKYIYFAETKKNLDSANKYLLKSDTYKYHALFDFENRNTRNGELIYKIIDTEKELNLAYTIRKKDAKASQILLFTTILISFFLLISLIILYFYFKAKKNIQSINKALKTSNDKLLNIDKNRLEFFSILSHELRTPIYGISGLATLIDQENDPTKKQNYLNSLIASSSYISTLIDNVLQANTLRFEKKNLHLKPARIQQIVKHVMSTVEIAAKNKGLDLNCYIEPSDENEFILVDKTAFSQVLINLVYNAIRYTLEGGVQIRVLLKERTADNVTIRFEIIDTGIGIKEKHRKVVFSAFENKTFLNKNSSGSGLGLFIVKTLLDSHNTKIDFKSVPNKGTTFFFETKFEIAKEKPKDQVVLPNPKKDMRVLVVDDNKINLLITQKNIEKIGYYNCDTASNGKESISMVKVKDYDIILMDINMPDMDGYEVTKHIRVFNPNVPIIALTALNSGEILIKAQLSGINQIITKPYIFEDFKAVILSFTNADVHFYKPTDRETI